MRVGTITYATSQGLGILAKAFYNNGIVTDVLVVEHRHRPTHWHWYPDSPSTPISSFNLDLARKLVDRVDVMLFFETPFDWSLIPYCRERGVLSVLMPMYECTPKALPYQPERFICPSMLDLRYFPDRSVYLPIPVDVAWRERKRSGLYVHNAGHLGLKGRNGTLELLQAMEYVKSPLRLLVRSQSRGLAEIIQRVPSVTRDERVELKLGSVSFNDLWAEGDVFVFPEKFNGLSLPLQEARAAGMLVMATNRFPMNEWLPTECLIPSHRSRRSSVSGRMIEFDEAIVEPRDIAATMDAWFDRDISEYSESGRRWAETMSWEALKPRYLEALKP